MIAALLIATAAPNLDEEVVFFSDDATIQSERAMDQPLCAEEERSLMKSLNSDTLRLYNSLDGKGKNRAIELSKKEADKNGAVHQAAREMAIRQNGEYPFQKDYQQQLEEEARVKPYTRRYGY